MTKLKKQKEKKSQLQKKKHIKINENERLRTLLPPIVILKIVQHLNLNEAFRFMTSCKYVRQTIIYQPDFDGQWVIKSFQSLLSKSGYSGLRNNNLRRIDIQQRGMHFQSQSILRDCMDDQWYIFGVWWNFAFFLIFIVIPILLIINEEYELELSIEILHSPAALSWVLLMIAIICLKYQVSFYHRKITTLHATNRAYHEMTNVQSVSKNPLDFNGCPEGRNTIHCKRYKLEWFKERFLISYIYCLFSAYLSWRFHQGLYFRLLQAGLAHWMDGCS